MIERIINWAVPNDIFKGFRLDHKVYVGAIQNEFGAWWYPWVDWDFYKRLSDDTQKTFTVIRSYYTGVGDE